MGHETAGDATWLEIIVRMSAGEGAEPPTEGVVAVRLDDDVEQLTRFRVRKHGARWRVEDESGRPRSIQDERYTVTFDEGDEPVRVDHTTGLRPSDEIVTALTRREAWDWQPSEDDYSRPIGPPRPTTFLGRDAWEVTLSPPAHKEGDLVMVVDAVDGRVLEQRNAAHGTFLRWEELRVVEPFGDDVFTWDGPFVTHDAFSGDDVPEELREEHERGEREGAALVGSLGLDDLVLPLAGDADGHVSSDGEAFLSWHGSGGFRLVRRRADALSDPDDEYAPTSTWAEGGWRWELTLGDVDGPAAAALTDVLRERTRGLSEPGGP